MKNTEAPIPIRSIIVLPRWLMVGGAALSIGCMLAGLGIAIYAFGWAEGNQLGGLLGGAFGCLAGGAGGMFGTMCDWRRRLPAPIYLQQIDRDEVHPFYRRVFWPALTTLIVGLLLGCFVWNHRAIWHGLVQTSGILAFVAGSIEASRRHSTRQARAVFALYADGALGPEDTAAIDDARAKDAKFQRDVEAYLQISEQLRDFTF